MAIFRVIGLSNVLQDYSCRHDFAHSYVGSNKKMKNIGEINYDPEDC